jgi:hypothetical protein
MRHLTPVFIGLVTATLSVAVTAQTNVTGRWNVVFNVEGEDNAATMTLGQDGGKLTGTIDRGQGLLEFDGKIDGDEIDYSLVFEDGGTIIEIAVSGTVDGDEINGTFESVEVGKGVWSATKAN